MGERVGGGPLNPVGLSSFLVASPFADDDLDRLAGVRRLGYDVFELCVEDPDLLHPEAVRAAASRTGLAVSICGFFGPGRDVSHSDPELRRAGLDYLYRCVDLAAAVGSPHVAGPMYSAVGKKRPLPEEDRERQRDRAARSLREVADYAAGRGVRLAVEPLNRYETDLVNTAEQGLALCERVGRDNVGLMLDTFHMNIEEQDFGEAIGRAGDRLFHFQVSENDRGAPGSGHLPWTEVFSALRDVDYGGWIVVESFMPTVAEIASAVSLWRPVAESPESLARDALAFLRRSLLEHRAGE